MNTTGMRYVVAALAVSTALLTGCGHGKAGDSGASAPVSAAPASATPAGNGVADLAPDEILQKAKAALVSAKSYRMKGTFSQDNETYRIDFKIRGSDIVGSMTMGKATVGLLRVGSQKFIRPDKAFWQMAMGNAKKAEAVTTIVNGRWVKVPPNDKKTGKLFDDIDASKLFEAGGSPVKGAVKTIDGKQAIALKDHDDAGTLYVATEGQPYPLRVDGATPPDSVTFSDFGAAFRELEMPAAKDVIDPAKLRG